MTAPATHRSAIVFIFITVLIDSIGFGIIIPVLPELIMQVSGAGLSQAARYGGWLYFIYAVTQFFCAPVIGNLGDRFGRRPVLLSALFALGIDYLVMGFAPDARVARSSAASLQASPALPMHPPTRTSPTSARRRNALRTSGCVGAAFGLGFVLGPSIGGLLGSFGPRTPFFVAAGLALLNATFGLFAVPESLPRERRRAFEWSRANPFGTLMQLRKHPSSSASRAWHSCGCSGIRCCQAPGRSTRCCASIGRRQRSAYSLAAAGIVMAISQGGLTRVLVPRLGGEQRAALVGIVERRRGLHVATPSRRTAGCCMSASWAGVSRP